MQWSTPSFRISSSTTLTRSWSIKACGVICTFLANICARLLSLARRLSAQALPRTLNYLMLSACKSTFTRLIVYVFIFHYCVAITQHTIYSRVFLTVSVLFSAFSCHVLLHLRLKALSSHSHPKCHTNRPARTASMRAQPRTCPLSCDMSSCDFPIAPLLSHLTTTLRFCKAAGAFWHEKIVTF